MPNPPIARFDDLPAGTSVQFSSAEWVLSTDRVDEVATVLRQVDEAVEQGAWAFGFIAYEAASGLDPDAVTRASIPGLPLVWFGLSHTPAFDVALPTPGPRFVSEWRLDHGADAHHAQVREIREQIARGQVYQVNLTTRARAEVSGDLYGWYAHLAEAQRGAHHGYLDLGRWAILSASPENFVAIDVENTASGDTDAGDTASGDTASGDTDAGDTDSVGSGKRVATCTPMKGTARRGTNPEDDSAARAQLLASTKDQAENLMIVDLIRNDLSRISTPGTVRVTDLFRCEPYPTVWQLTSQIEGQLVPEADLVSITAALFPSGSVTGAPKLAAMQVIADLEDSPRGVYCGAVGYLAPGPRRRARFNVAIRTVLVDRDAGLASYGVGGGITWSSDPAEEFDEVLAKTAVLDHTPAPHDPPDGTLDRDAAADPAERGAATEVDLIETFAITNTDGELEARNLELHLDRLTGSAAELGFAPVPLAEITAAVAALGSQPVTPDQSRDCLQVTPDPPIRLVRLRYRRDGSFTLEPRPAGEVRDPVRLVIDTVQLDHAAPHKTSDRRFYADAAARHPGVDDVILVSRSGRVSETTIANLLVLIDGVWYTPPLADGALPGIGRALLLASGEIRERSLTVDEVRSADEIEIVNSARGRRSAVLLEPSDQAGGPSAPPA